MPKTKLPPDCVSDLRNALARFADIAPLVARSGDNHARITALADRLIRLTDLAMSAAPAEPGPKERAVLDYVPGRLHALLDQAEVAATFTGPGDGAFDERRFAANIDGADIGDLHIAARYLSGDTDGLTPADLAAGFHAFDGVSAGFGRGLLDRIKALIVAIFSLLARLGVIKAGLVQRIIDILARIDEILGGEVAMPPPPPPPPVKRFVTLDAGENLTVDVDIPFGKTAFVQRVAFDDENGGDEFVTVKVGPKLAGTLRKGADVVAVPGPATVRLQFTTQNAGVQAVVCVVTI